MSHAQELSRTRDTITPAMHVGVQARTRHFLSLRVYDAMPFCNPSGSLVDVHPNMNWGRGLEFQRRYAGEDMKWAKLNAVHPELVEGWMAEAFMLRRSKHQRFPCRELVLSVVDWVSWEERISLAIDD